MAPGRSVSYTHLAREATLRCLACLKAELGSLDRVEKIFKVLGFIASAPGFTAQPTVLNPVSYTHLDVYKRQILILCRFFILRILCLLYTSPLHRLKAM